MSRSFRFPKRTLVIATVGGASLIGGLAAAGALPGAVDSHAVDATTEAGATTPSPNGAANGHADVRGESAEILAEQLDSTAGEMGAAVSELATTTESTGVDKGAEISTLASGGVSQAGAEHPSATVPPTLPAVVPDIPDIPEIPVSTPGPADQGLSRKP